MQKSGKSGRTSGAAAGALAAAVEMVMKEAVVAMVAVCIYYMYGAS